MAVDGVLPNVDPASSELRERSCPHDGRGSWVFEYVEGGPGATSVTGAADELSDLALVGLESEPFDGGAEGGDVGSCGGRCIHTTNLRSTTPQKKRSLLAMTSRFTYHYRMWNDLSTRHLLAMLAVAEEGTFGRAASRLGFTQSAVSQQVASLEAQVGQRLFDRPSGPVQPRLTPAGELLRVHALAIIERIQSAEHDLDRHSRGVIGHLAIGTFQSISARVLPATLRTLREEAPDVEVSLLEEDLNDHSRIGAFGRDDLDLAFLVNDVDPRLEFRSLGTDPYVAVVEADYPAGPVRLAEIAQRPVVGQPADDPCGQAVDRGLERHGFTPHYVFRSHDNGAIQAMVSAGVGAAIVPLLTVDTSDPTVSVRPTIPELPPRALSIAWSRDRTLAPIGRRFVDIATEVCAQQLLAPTT